MFSFFVVVLFKIIFHCCATPQIKEKSKLYYLFWALFIYFFVLCLYCVFKQLKTMMQWQSSASWGKWRGFSVVLLLKIKTSKVCQLNVESYWAFYLIIFRLKYCWFCLEKYMRGCYQVMRNRNGIESSWKLLESNFNAK